MNLKKKLRNFFTLSRKANAGFTLVELIVVIAILAILGGVAVPAYSGYVKKAERSADEALLNELNTAFASACAINGENHIGRTDATASITDGEATVEVTNIDGFEDAFSRLYEGGIFKGEDLGLSYNQENGMFEFGVQLLYGGVAITVPQQVVDALRDSTYATMGGEVLGDTVDSVSTLASWLISGPYLNWDGDPANEPTGGIYSLAMNETFLASLGYTRDEVFAMMDESEASAEATAKYLANGLVLYAAKDAGTLDTNTIVSSMTSNPSGYVEQLKSGLTSGSSAALSEAALVYSIYASYVYNQDPATAQDKLAAVNGSNGLINALDTMTTDPGFADYMQGQGASDANAFKDAMSVINSAASNQGTSDKIMNEGFATDELAGILKDVLGK